MLLSNIEQFSFSHTHCSGNVYRISFGLVYIIMNYPIDVTGVTSMG